MYSRFLRFVRALLEREQFWTEWKQNDSAPFRKGLFSFPDNFKPSTGLLRPIESHRAQPLFDSTATFAENPLEICRRPRAGVRACPDCAALM